ncbi:MAG: FAD-dependent monooxygenase [Tatlockia sp.]|nr:FAD-dependent monooxygenase [Tatlockia sp.]
MSKHFDVAVVGAGIVGLCAALSMNLRGFSVALIDAGQMIVDEKNPDARVYAINEASQNLLKNLGAWQCIDSSRISPYRQMYVWDSSSGAHIDFNSRMIASDRLGTIVEESILKKALLHALSLQKTGISLFPNSKVKALNEYEEFIEILSEDSSWQAKLLMIADGGNSPCRQLLKVPLTSWSYHQEAIVALVTTEKAHQQTAYQVFNKDGPLAFLPMVNEKLCSIVWSTTQINAKELMTLSNEDFNKALTKAFAAKLGESQVCGKRFQFPLLMRHVKQYTGSRWILLGDAAHTIHPLAGLGLNVGLADLSTWLSGMEKGEKQLTAKKAMSAYQRQRKSEVWQTIAMMDSLKTLFGNSSSPVIAIRSLGLQVINHFSPIKKLFINMAIGKKAL